MSRPFLFAIWLAWLILLALVVTGSVLIPLQRHAPWESSGISHFLAYAALGFLPMLTGPGWRKAGVLLVGLAVLGIGLEWIQTGLPGRFGMWEDAAINALGAITGLATGWAASPLFIRPRV